ncbi:MAG: ATP-binding protein, partial [Anaerolineales bacterium]
VLVILEDAHWLDSASWSLAYLVSRDVRPILLVLATRPLTEPIPEDYNFLLRLPHTRRIVLEALAPEEAMLLVCHRLGVKALPEAVAALIREKAQGNPFFSEELAYALRDAGLIEIQEGGAERTCRVAPGVGDLHALEFPDTVQGVVTSRIDRLPPAQQLTVKVASVIGRVFALRALHDVHPVEVDRPMLPAYLSTLEQWDIALLETPEPELAYIFKHVITQEVAYNLLLFVQRRQLHRAVAEWYEHSFASDLTRFYPLLAHHWLNAIETPEKDAATGKAIEYLEKAGAEALRGYANQEAIKFLTQALELDHRARTTSEPLRRAIWERQLGQAQLGLGQLPEAKAHFHRGLEILGWPMPIEPGRLVLSLLKQVARQVMHRLFPTRATPQSPDKEEDRQQQARFLEAARAYENLAEIYCFQSNTLASVYGCVATPNVAEQASTSAELARAYSNMCAAAGVVALHSLADAYRAHAQATTQRLNHTHTTAHMLARTSLFSIGMGRWEQARVDLTQAREVARRLGDRRLWGESTANLAFTEYFTGNFALSANYCEEVVAEGRRTEDPQHQSWAYYQAQHELILGHTEEAIHLLETALAQLAKQPEVNGEITSYGVLARARLRRGQLDLARQAADKGAELIAKASATAFSNIEGYAGVAETYLALWEADLNSGRAASRFGPLARRACKAFGQLGGPFPACRPRALLWRGRCEWLAGRKSPALKTWRKDLALAESLRIPYEVGLAHLELGRRLPANDPRLQRVCDRS